MLTRHGGRRTNEATGGFRTSLRGRQFLLLQNAFFLGDKWKVKTQSSQLLTLAAQRRTGVWFAAVLQALKTVWPHLDFTGNEIYVGHAQHPACIKTAICPYMRHHGAQIPQSFRVNILRTKANSYHGTPSCALNHHVVNDFTSLSWFPVI